MPPPPRPPPQHAWRLTDRYLYLTGETVRAPRRPVAVVVARTPTGWVSRATLRDTLWHVYPSHESVQDVHDWLVRDLTALTPISSRAAMRAHLATRLAEGAACPLEAWAPDPRSSSDAAAERVLRHLESGC